LPPSLREWLPEEQLAWFVLDAVAEMDVGAFVASYREDGWDLARWSFEPELSVAIAGCSRSPTESRPVAWCGSGSDAATSPAATLTTSARTTPRRPAWFMARSAPGCCGRRAALTGCRLPATGGPGKWWRAVVARSSGDIACGRRRPRSTVAGCDRSPAPAAADASAAGSTPAHAGARRCASMRRHGGDWLWSMRTAYAAVASRRPRPQPGSKPRLKGGRSPVRPAASRRVRKF
jgi:hypothetical protein